MRSSISAAAALTSGRRARSRGVAGVIVAQAPVGVPVVARVAEIDLHEAHPGLEAAAREHALPGELVGGGRVDAVGGERRGALAADVEHPRRLRLHAPGGLERLDPRLEAVVAPPRGEESPLALEQQFELGPLPLGAERRGEVREPRGLEVGAAVADPGALEGGRQEGRAVVLGAAVVERGGETDEAGEVVVLAAESVERPGAEAGACEDPGAGVHGE